MKPVRPRPAGAEPFRVRPVELVMLEQRWLALWNAVEIGELPVEEWRSLTASLSVSDPSGSRWRIAPGSEPDRLRFARCSDQGEWHVEDTEWPWKGKDVAQASPRTHLRLTGFSQSRRSPMLPAQITYAPGAAGLLNPAPSTTGRSTDLGVLARSLVAWFGRGGGLGSTRPRTVIGAALAAACLLWAFLPRGSAGPAPLFPPAPAAVDPSRIAVSPATAFPALLPNATGALTPSSFDWEAVTCFSGEAWNTTHRLVGVRVPCAGLHRVATAVLPHPAAVADPLIACASASALLEPRGTRQAASGQWLDVDGGLLVCTISPVDPADTGPVIP